MDTQTLVPGAPCTFCGQPANLSLGIMSASMNLEANIYVCDFCYHLGFKGSDELTAQAYKGVMEAQSAGYTDAGFLREMRRTLEARGGCVATLVIEWIGDVEGEPCGKKAEFLGIGLPNTKMASSGFFWVRSRLPMHYTLQQTARQMIPTYEVPSTTAYVENRWFAAQVKEGKLVTQKNVAVAQALHQQCILQYGNPDFYTLVANWGSPAGYELLRRAFF